jgi:glutamate carboxypeptidase
MQTFMALNFLRRIMSIDSQTRNIDGVNTVQDLISGLLREWGFEVDQIAHPNEKSGYLCFAEKRNSTSDRWINFIGHADTVLPSRPLEVGDVIWKGSGIADNKGGVVTLLQTLWNLRESNLPFNYRVIISPNEETGSSGFHGHFKKWGAEAFLNLGFEPALENDELIESRNGNRWYEIEMSTLSAHAGRAMKGRLNLIHRASQFVMNLENELSIDSKTKFNVTSFQTGNEAFNVIPNSIKLRLDSRFNSFHGRERFHSLFETEFKKFQLPCALTNVEITSSYSIADDCPPMSASAEFDLEGIPYCFIHSGGAADINYFSTPDNYSIDGWGGRGAQLHSKEEWLDTNSVFERAEVLSKWLELLATKSTEEKKTEIRNKPDSVFNYHSSRP